MVQRLARHIAGLGVAAAIAAATFAVPATARAQRLSLAERVSRLEQQAQNRDQGSLTLVNQVQALQSQVQQLQGQVEELQHQLKQLQESSKDQYVDLDSRVRRLEGGKGNGAAHASSAAKAASPAVAASAAPSAGGTSAAAGHAPASASSAAAPDNVAAAQADYNNAFQSLRSGDFVQASRQFSAFIQRYPNDALTPNAFYWLGESYYVTQNYQVALQTFQKLVKQFPDSEKTPGAWLKIGYCQDAMRDPKAAQNTLNAVISKYPDSDVARLAKRRLHDIQLQQAH